MGEDELRYEARMSDSDALMWTIEKDPLLRSTITAVSLLDGVPQVEPVLDKIDRATRLIPRLRQRVVGNPFSLAPPRWEVDPRFDLHYHARRVRAGGDGSWADVLELAEWVAMSGFDRARPLWEIYLVDGVAGGRSALIQKIHHSITDGVGSIKMALTVFDLEREPGDPGPMPEAPEAEVLGMGQRLADGLGHLGRRQLGIARRSGPSVAGAALRLATDPVGSAQRAVATTASVGRLLSPATSPMSPLMTRRSLSSRFATLGHDLDAMKRAAKAAESRLNDAFVAAVAGGLARYHEQAGVPVDALRMTMPINVRGAETEAMAGNQFVPARFPVPLDITDPVERMATIRDLVAAQRGEPALALTQPLAGLLNRLPTGVTTGVFGSMLKGIDFVTSNVPGAPIPLFLAGTQVVEQYAFGPMTGAATNVVLLSWLDRVNIGINMDPVAVTDPDRFRACLEEGFDEVTAVG